MKRGNRSCQTVKSRLYDRRPVAPFLSRSVHRNWNSIVQVLAQTVKLRVDLGQASSAFENQLRADFRGGIVEQEGAEIILFDQPGNKPALGRREAQGFAEKVHVVMNPYR